ncbi:MAG: hypothetical protein RLZZ501_1435 [Pseudomonadota bacterium]|jgi:hypothetical protein
MPLLTSGQVAAPLGDDSVTLVPSIEAITGISRVFGGIDPAAKRVLALDIEAHATIITLAAGLKGAAARAVAGQIYRQGIDKTVLPLTDYLLILRNGGRPLDAEVDASAEGELPG